MTGPFLKELAWAFGPWVIAAGLTIAHGYWKEHRS